MLEEFAHKTLEPYLERFALAAVKGFETYRTKYPHRSIHRKTTTASVICDEIWAEIVNSLDADMPQIRPIEGRYGLRFMGVQGPTGDTEILLWFKKVDGKRNARCAPTKAAQARLSGGTVEMFEQATVLIVGYRLNPERTKISLVSITKPSLGRPEWYIDLELPNTDKVVKMTPDENSHQTPKVRVVVKRIVQDRLVE